MIKPTLEEAKKLAQDNSVVPVALEVFSDVTTSIQLLKNIRRKSKNWFILESVTGSDSWSRYTFLGYSPTLAVYGANGTTTIQNGANETLHHGDPVTIVRKILAQYKSPRIAYLPPFTGGFVGYFAYEFASNFIPGLRLQAPDTEGFQDFHLMLMDKVIAFDHFKQKIYLIVNVPTSNLENNYIEAITTLKDMEKLVLEPLPAIDEPPCTCGEFTPLFTKDAYIKMVRQVQHHITEGDIFQAVLSNRFKAPFTGNLMQVYRVLRTSNPSPYMVYMNVGNTEIACSSPETLVSLRDGEISSFPLAGTCPRGATEQEDAALTTALLEDPKELSEHDMLVDLARNDVGKVSRFGSVNVKEYRQIKRFAHVSHIASHVTGQLQEGADAMDVLAATLPAGTLSGAPKKRACEIIDAAENTKRGVYGGAIGYIDFAGNMDMCIGIRMAILQGGQVYVQSGAGIVAESIPENEYNETRNKARAVMDAVKLAGGANNGFNN